MPRTRLYRGGRLEKENFPVEEISDVVTASDAVVWLDLSSPDHAELELVANEFGLHVLAVEDALDKQQRPKLDVYPTHIFISAYSARFDDVSGELATSEVAAFVTDHALITVRKDRQFDIDAVVARWDAAPQMASHGVGFLLHGFLDQLVDSHFESVQTLDEAIEGLEDLLFDGGRRTSEVQRRSFEVRKSLVLLRRVLLPMREVVNSVMRHNIALVDTEMMPYYQDLYDHVLRAYEWTESLRDLVATILETHLTIQGNQLNLIMKKVTSWAAIIAVPTAITGFYGQNVPYPGFAQASGFIMSTSLTIILSVGLYILFKRRDWV